MPWRLVWSPRAVREAQRLSRQDRERVVAALTRYAETDHGDVKRLRDLDPPEWRLRVGDIRVRFRFDRTAGVIEILRVLPRGRAYRA